MKKSLKLYTDIFDTQWSDSELLKRVSIVFVSSFVGTIVMFFVISLAFGGFNYTHALLNLLRLEDSVAVFLLFSAALLQMSGWVIMLQIWHKIVFRTWF